MQTSSKKLNKQVAKDLHKQLATVLADLDHPTEVANFLGAFLSETELNNFAKRLGIITLLAEGSSYQEISLKLKVSSATIANMAEDLDNYGYQRILELLKRDRKIRSVLTKLGVKK